LKGEGKDRRKDVRPMTWTTVQKTRLQPITMCSVMLWSKLRARKQDRTENRKGIRSVFFTLNA
jgi:hypothetical protein